MEPQGHKEERECHSSERMRERIHTLTLWRCFSYSILRMRFPDWFECLLCRSRVQWKGRNNDPGEGVGGTTIFIKVGLDYSQPPKNKQLHIERERETKREPLT